MLEVIKDMEKWYKWFDARQFVEPFKNHKILEYSEDKIVWGQPGTGIGRVTYRLENGALHVGGDYGFAVYVWYGKISWAFLASTDFSYFLGKCQASEVGRNFDEWCPKTAERFLKELWEDKESAFKPEHLEECLNWTSSKLDWQMFLHDRGYDVFGDDYYEHDPGTIPNGRCVLHWMGLKLLWEKLKAEHY